MVHNYTDTCTFNELEELHQMAIAHEFAARLKVRKAEVIKKIFNLTNPELHYNKISDSKERITNFQFSEKSWDILRIAFRNYIHEAL